MNNELVERPVGGPSSTLCLHVGIVRINFVVEKIIVDQSVFFYFFNSELVAVRRKKATDVQEFAEFKLIIFIKDLGRFDTVQLSWRLLCNLRATSTFKLHLLGKKKRNDTNVSLKLLHGYFSNLNPRFWLEIILNPRRMKRKYQNELGTSVKKKKWPQYKYSPWTFLIPCSLFTYVVYPV